MPLLNETLTALSCGSQAASIVLREALRFKTRPGSLIVHDATGRGAMILSPANKMGMERKRIVWVDLADRRRPVSLFRIARSAHFRPLWVSALRSVRSVAKANIGDAAIDWAAEASWALSNDGSVRLGALYRSLSSAEIRRWFLDTNNEPSELGRLLDMLAWSLSFPAVHALSEGENRGDLLHALDKPSVVWLESAVEHFEPRELLVQILIEAAIDDALRTMAGHADDWKDAMKGLTVLHLHPVASVSRSLEDWVQAHLGMVRHVGVHHLAAERSLSPEIVGWAKTSEFLWVAGSVGAMRKDCHDKWLSDAEMGRIAELTNNELWVRSNRSGKALVTRVRDCAVFPGMAERFRTRAARRRKTATLDQIAAAIRSLAAPSEAYRDLYSRLSEVETLRTGWLRVRESRAQSSGVDGVTIASFAETLEPGLTALSEALRSGRYRSMPLRRMQIPKNDGGVRNLGIACVRDRVVQAACLALIEPIFEPGFSRFSYAFRPGRGAHQAVAVARSMIASGRSWAVIADIRKCFDSIDHNVLLGFLAKKIADDDLLALIRGWLGVDVLEFRDLLPTDAGVPQGESLSPLLANIYLDPLDKHFERLGVPFVRYADDFVVFAGNEEGARTTFLRLGDFLRDTLHLELKPAKTSYLAVSEGFDFLGFRIKGNSLTVIPERTQTLIEYLTGVIRDLAACAEVFDKAAACLSRINSIVRGWRNYFLLPGEAALHGQMAGLDERIEQIAAFHLPESLRGNPAWLCRERLSVSAPDDSARYEQASQRVPRPGTGYPETDRSENRAAWEPANGAGTQPRESAGISGGLIGRNGAHSGTGTAPFSASLEDGERLYVLTHRAWVSASRGDLVLRKKREEIYRRPIEKIALVYLQGFGISISLDAQLKLAERDIPVVLALPIGNPVAVINPIETSRSSIRRLQAVRRDEPDVVKAGLGMISAKISNQAAVLKYFAKYRKLIERSSRKRRPG